jgi:hypothetical protein
MGFILFLLVNASLFLRPGDMFSGLQSVPFYEPLIIGCLIVSLPRVLPLLRVRSLAEQPITICMFGLLLAVILSHLTHGYLWGARKAGMDFVKVVIYYLLLVALVDTPGRLRMFLFSLACFTVLLTLAALLHHHGAFRIPAIAAWEDEWIELLDQDSERGAAELTRLRGTGLFLDPNDFCLILLIAAAISLYFLTDRSLGGARLLWVGPLILFGYAFSLTESRGGFIALLAGLFALLQCRLGWRRAIGLGAIMLPAVLLLFAGRQTGISVEAESGQGRLRNWSQALVSFGQDPLFGIGYGNFPEVNPEVVHNSYLESQTELGFFGGTFFIGAFFYALWILARPRNADSPELSPDEFHHDEWNADESNDELERLRPYLTALIVSYATGIILLSRVYIVPTYMVVGLATVYFRLVKVPHELLVFNGRLAMRFAAVSASSLFCTYLFVRLFVIWQ